MPLPDNHQHKCHCCGSVWSHHKSRIVIDGVREHLAHDCPQCGTHNNGIRYYSGNMFSKVHFPEWYGPPDLPKELS